MQLGFLILSTTFATRQAQHGARCRNTSKKMATLPWAVAKYITLKCRRPKMCHSVGVATRSPTTRQMGAPVRHRIIRGYNVSMLGRVAKVQKTHPRWWQAMFSHWCSQRQRGASSGAFLTANGSRPLADQKIADNTVAQLRRAAADPKGRPFSLRWVCTSRTCPSHRHRNSTPCNCRSITFSHPALAPTSRLAAAAWHPGGFGKPACSYNVSVPPIRLCRIAERTTQQLLHG